MFFRKNARGVSGFQYAIFIGLVAVVALAGIGIAGGGVSGTAPISLWA
jgi:hypothetical protein